MVNEINKLFEKAKKGNLDLEEIEDYEIEQQLKDIKAFDLN